MKKYGIFKVLALLLALLLTVCMFASCDLFAKEEPEETTAPTETTAPEDDSNQKPSTPTPSKPVENKPYVIKAQNGVLTGGASQKNFAAGESVALIAGTAPNGYAFSHWENSAGELVSTDSTTHVTVTKSESYKAYFEPCISTAFTQNILNDRENDWQQGGFDGSFGAFNVGASAVVHRISLVEPFFMAKGSSISITLPAIECPTGTHDDCRATVAFVTMDKVAGSNTGNLMVDYTILSKSWYNTGVTYQAAGDVYVMLTVKYDSDGSTAFNINTPISKNDPTPIIDRVEIKYTEAASGVEGNPIGSYWNAELEETIESVKANRENASSYLSEFFFLTDTHWSVNAQYSPALINYLADKLDAYYVVFNGDVVQRYQETKQEGLDEINGFYNALEGFSKIGEKLKIFSTLGNHDRNGSSNQPDKTQRLTEQEAYDAYIKRVESFGVTDPGNPNCSYYDDAANKVRYVQFYFAGSQYGMIEDAYVDPAFDWVAEKVKELSSDWTVVLFTHGYFCDVEGGENEITPRDVEIRNKVLQLKAEADADLAIWITGHNHHDRSVVLTSQDGATSIRLISLNADAYTHSSSGYKMKLGGSSEQSFSFFQIDPVNKKIYITRVGAGIDAVYTYGEPTATDDGNGPNKASETAKIRVVNGTFEDGTINAEVEVGATVTLQAMEAPAGYRFSHWKDSKGNILGYTTELTVTATETTTYTAMYTMLTYSNITVVGGALDNGLEFVEKVVVGTEITLVAMPHPFPEDYRFSRWENSDGETVGTTPTLTVNTTGKDTYTAYYERIVRVASYVVNGTFADGSSSAIAAVGDKITVYAKMPANMNATDYGFLYWTDKDGNVVATTLEATITVEKGNTYTAVFSKSFVQLINGTFTNGSDIAYTPISEYGTHTATADVAPNGYVFKCWKDENGNVYSTDRTITIAITPSYPYATVTTYRAYYELGFEGDGNDNAAGAYWQAELADGIAKINQNRQMIGEGIVEFFYLTDTHWFDNAQYSPALLTYVAEQVNAEHVVFGGDVIRRYNSSKESAIADEIEAFYDAFTEYTEYGKQLKIFSMLGNHDRNYSSGNTDKNLIIDEATAYELFLARMEGWGVTTDGNPNQGYYDDVENKVRFIQFYFAGSQHGMPEDSYVDDAMAYVEEKVLELDSDWTVMLFTHGFFCDAEGGENEVTEKDYDVALRMLQLQADADAEIAMWITGHIHEDRDEVLVAEDGTTLRLISLNCDAYKNSNSPTSYDMTVGTVSEQSFSFLQIDLANKRVYLTRFGAGEDLVFEYGQGLEGSMEFYPKKNVAIFNGEATNVAGKNVSNKGQVKVAVGDTITMVADAAPAGYAFECWKDNLGNVVGTDATLTVTVGEELFYKAYYKDIDPTNDTYAEGQIMTDINDWVQGSWDGSFIAWVYDGSARESRVTFAEPYELKKGQTIKVTVPNPVTCPNGACENKTCSLAVAYVVLEKIEGSDTGNLGVDYTIKSKSWASSGSQSYTASEDCLIVMVIKYDKHGGLPFTLSHELMEDVVVTVK